MPPICLPDLFEIVERIGERAVLIDSVESARGAAHSTPWAESASAGCRAEFDATRVVYACICLPPVTHVGRGRRIRISW